MQGDSFASEPDGIMEVAMWLSASLLVGLNLAWVQYPTTVCWFKRIKMGVLIICKVIIMHI
jgi:hypothetical protein